MPTPYGPACVLLSHHISLTDAARRHVAVATQGFDSPVGVPGLGSGLSVLSMAVGHLKLSIGTPPDGLIKFHKEVAIAPDLAQEDGGSLKSLVGHASSEKLFRLYSRFVQNVTDRLVSSQATPLDLGPPPGPGLRAHQPETERSNFSRQCALY